MSDDLEFKFSYTVGLVGLKERKKFSNRKDAINALYALAKDEGKRLGLNRSVMSKHCAADTINGLEDGFGDGSELGDVRTSICHINSSSKYRKFTVKCKLTGIIYPGFPAGLSFW